VDKSRCFGQKSSRFAVAVQRIPDPGEQIPTTGSAEPDRTVSGLAVSQQLIIITAGPPALAARGASVADKC